MTSRFFAIFGFVFGLLCVGVPFFSNGPDEKMLVLAFTCFGFAAVLKHLETAPGTNDGEDG